MAGPHVFTDDGSGISCDDCGMPKQHPRHITLNAAPPVLKPVPDLGVSLTPEQSETSQRAALHTAWPRAGTKRAQVLDAVAACGEYGATDDELVFDTDMNPNTLRPRRGELVEHGWLVPARDESGRYRVRPTGSGAEAQVWVLSRLAQQRLHAHPLTA